MHYTVSPSTPGLVLKLRRKVFGEFRVTVVENNVRPRFAVDAEAAHFGVAIGEFNEVRVQD